MQLTTPALIFSTISLLLLAYTSRYLGISTLIRSLHETRKEKGERTEIIEKQIKVLKKRLNIIKNMQLFGIFSLVLCIISMLFIFFNLKVASIVIFIISLILLIISLLLTAYEIHISVEALQIQLGECVGDCECENH